MQMRKWITLVEGHQEIDYLYHGTYRGNIESILSGGLNGPSYWGNRHIAQDYADQFGDDGVIIRVPINHFDHSELKPNTLLIQSLIDDHDEDTKMLDTWQASLAEYDTVVYEVDLTISEDWIEE